MSLTILTAKSADVITCTGGHKDELTLIRYISTSHPERKNWFKVSIDEGLSSSYIGVVEGRIVTREKLEKNEIFSDWDGKSGVKISFPNGALNSAVGAVFKAQVEVECNDIAQDLVQNILICKVIK